MDLDYQKRSDLTDWLHHSIRCLLQGCRVQATVAFKVLPRVCSGAKLLASDSTTLNIKHEGKGCCHQRGKGVFPASRGVRKKPLNLTFAMRIGLQPNWEPQHSHQWRVFGGSRCRQSSLIHSLLQMRHSVCGFRSVSWVPTFQSVDVGQHCLFYYLCLLRQIFG